MKPHDPKIQSSDDSSCAPELKPASLDRRALGAATLQVGTLGALGALTGIGGSAASATANPTLASGQAESASGSTLKQSVCRWCFAKTPLEVLARKAKEIGLQSVELLEPDEIATVQQHGLACAVVNSHPLWNGLADTKYHETCVAAIRKGIDAAAEHGCPNVITFSGNRRGISDEDGLRNSADALAQVVPYAAQKGVTIIMELLNSKVDHPDYLCDRTRWGVDLVEKVGSQHFKLLYDIYHMQIMEGDVIRTIRDHHDKIAHYHTAGVPGRHELDENQELFYPAIVRAILETGYQGYLGQEFIPTAEDPFASLAAGVDICAV